MIKRLRNLWRISEIDMPKPSDGNPLSDKIKAVITGKRPATIIEMDKPEMFPDHVETT